MEGAVEPDLHVAEQEMDDGQHGVGVGRPLSATTQGVMRLTRLARQITTYRLKAASDGEHPSLTEHPRLAGCSLATPDPTHVAHAGPGGCQRRCPKQCFRRFFLIGLVRRNRDKPRQARASTHLVQRARGGTAWARQRWHLDL